MIEEFLKFNYYFLFLKFQAMSFDPLNHYQLTAAQIKRKIELFKTIPPQYNAYLRAKGLEADSSVDEKPNL